jgi:hypothetical protein
MHEVCGDPTVEEGRCTLGIEYTQAHVQQIAGTTHAHTLEANTPAHFVSALYPI